MIGSVGIPTAGLSSAGNITFGFATPTGLSNAVLTVGVTLFDGDAAAYVVGVTYGGVAMALKRRSGYTGGASWPQRTEVWYLPFPVAGAANVVVTLSVNKYAQAIASCFSGVATGSPFTLDAEYFNGSVTVASTIGNLVIDFQACNDYNNTQPTVSVSGGNTLLINQSANFIGFGHSYKAGAASVTTSWSASTGGTWAGIALSLRPSGGTQIIMC